MQRDSVVFYRSFYEALDSLEGDDYVTLSKALFSYMFDGQEADLRGVAKGYFKLMKPQIDANNAKFVNAKKGGAATKARAKQGQTEAEPRPKRGQSKAEIRPNEGQKETKPRANVNVNANVNENDNVNVLVEKFFKLPDEVIDKWKRDVKKWLETKGNYTPTDEEVGRLCIEFYKRNPDKHQPEPVPLYRRPV